MKYHDCVFRGVSIDRYESIKRNFIDVEPQDAVVFADCLEKALEYGGWPKLILVLRWKFMSRSFQCVSAETPPDELDRIRQQYPSLVNLMDGTLWFSRLPEGDVRIASMYESAYGWYVSGDPKDALAALMICCRPEDMGVARSHILGDLTAQTVR